MDWLDPTSTFSDADLEEFDFHPSSAFSSPTVHIQRPRGEETTFQQAVLKSEEDYTKWLREVVPSPLEGHPGVIFVVHPRIPSGDSNGPANPGSTSLRQSIETFQEAATRLFQHRSIAYVVRRRSTAILTSRQASWGEQYQGPSIVYNCRSDTESPGNEDDMALSVTWFPEHEKSYGVLYGCPKQMLRDAKGFTDKICHSGTAFHPLLLPVIFIELERKRLFDNFDNKKSRIHTRIINMERRLVKEDSSESAGDEEKGGAEDAAEGWEATKLWMEASSLNSGLESFRVQLGGMVEHSKWLSERYFAANGGAHGYDEERQVGRGIEGRLWEIMNECESKGRSLETLLKGMSLATQMEWNYLSRQNARQSHLIAERAKHDSGQMTTIARLGMIFLPGTFLASFFSMGFFKWIPEDSKQVVSPYLVIYAALAVGMTYLIFTKFWKWRIWRVLKRKGKRPAGVGEV